MYSYPTVVSRSQTLFLDARRRRAKKGSGTPPIDNAVLTSTLVGVSDDWCKLPLLRLANHDRRAPHDHVRPQSASFNAWRSEFSAALDEVVREAGLTTLKRKQREAIEGIVSGKMCL